MSGTPFTNNSAGVALVTVATCASDFDTALMVWRPMGQPCDFATFSAVACNDDFCGDGLQSTLNFDADPGVTYEIQAGGFEGETGNLSITIDCVVLNCPPLVINGTLGSGAPAFAGAQFSGNQTGRLNRNGVASSCAAAKACDIFDPANLRAFDAYEIPNLSGQDACVKVTLNEMMASETCNLQSNAYLDTYDPANICTGYLADPGLSTGMQPSPINFSTVVPAGHTLIIVVHTTNPGESGCNYALTLLGDLCPPFDACLQDDSSPSTVIQFNTMTGDYRFCCHGTTYTGKGVVTKKGSTFTLQHYTNNRRVLAQLDTATKRGSASLQSPPGRIICTIADRNTTNNSCACQ